MSGKKGAARAFPSTSQEAISTMWSLEWKHDEKGFKTLFNQHGIKEPPNWGWTCWIRGRHRQWIQYWHSRTVSVKEDTLLENSERVPGGSMGGRIFSPLLYFGSTHQRIRGRVVAITNKDPVATGLGIDTPCPGR